MYYIAIQVKVLSGLVFICLDLIFQGIIGNDNRHYILDLLRTFPPDVNFLKGKSRQRKCLILEYDAHLTIFKIAVDENSYFVILLHFCDGEKAFYLIFDQKLYVPSLIQKLFNWVEFSVEGEEIELSDEVKELSFPRQHRHKLVCLRQELVDAFVE